MKTESKSDAVRNIMAKQPKATPKEIHAALTEKGVKLSLALVNKIKYGRRAKRTRKQGSKAQAIRQTWSELGKTARPRDIIETLAIRGVTVTSAQVSTLRGASVKTEVISMEHLVAAKQLADKVGGVDVAREALAALVKLL